MEKQAEQPKSFEQLRNGISNVLEALIHSIRTHRTVFDHEMAPIITELQGYRVEPFLDVVTRIIDFTNGLNDYSRTDRDNDPVRLQEFLREVLAIQKPKAEADVTANLDPLLGTMVNSMMGPIARGVAECLTHMGLGSATERTRLLAARDLEKKLRAAEERLAKVTELENTLRRIRGERNTLRERVAELTRRLDSMVGAKDFMEGKYHEWQGKAAAYAESVRRLLEDKQRLEGELRRKGGRGGDTDVVSCVRVEEEIFKSPLSILGVSAAEVMEAYRTKGDEHGFKRELKRISYQRIHTDKYAAILKKIKEIGDPEISLAIEALLQSRLKRAEDALNEIWQQLSRNGSLKAEWVRE